MRQNSKAKQRRNCLTGVIDLLDTRPCLTIWGAPFILRDELLILLPLPQIRSRACLLTGSLSMVSGAPLPHPLKGIHHVAQGKWHVRVPAPHLHLEQAAMMQRECKPRPDVCQSAHFIPSGPQERSVTNRGLTLNCDTQACQLERSSTAAPPALDPPAATGRQRFSLTGSCSWILFTDSPYPMAGGPERRQNLQDSMMQQHRGYDSPASNPLLV